jgi:hypothetical protein
MTRGPSWQVVLPNEPQLATSLKEDERMGLGLVHPTEQGIGTATLASRLASTGRLVTATL